MAKLCLFGAGNTGRKFLDSQSYKRCLNKYTDIVFYDNDPNLPENIEGIKRVENLDKDMAILITSRLFRGIYSECIIRKINVIGIWNPDEDCVYDYKTMCKKARSGYENDEMIEYNESANQAYEINLKEYQKTNDLYHNTLEVAIMLSNLCNYASIHQRCPANCIKTKEIMPKDKVCQIMDELGDSGYKGSICFHIYNEPTMDPRLFMFIKYAKNKMPTCKVRIYSNGYYLNKMMTDEFHDIGADALVTTGYGIEEYERLIDIGVEYPYSVVWGNLDERMDWYNRENTGGGVYTAKCSSLLKQVCIYSNGEIGTCCLDYKTPYRLGNIFESSLKEVLNNRKVIGFQNELLRGDRSRFPICGNCHWSI